MNLRTFPDQGTSIPWNLSLRLHTLTTRLIPGGGRTARWWQIIDRAIVLAVAAVGIHRIGLAIVPRQLIQHGSGRLLVRLVRRLDLQRPVVTLKLPQEPLDRHAHQLRSAERRHIRKLELRRGGKLPPPADRTRGRGGGRISFFRAGYASASMSDRISLETNMAETGIRRCPPTISSPPVCM